MTITVHKVMSLMSTVDCVYEKNKMKLFNSDHPSWIFLYCISKFAINPSLIMILVLSAPLRSGH
jgi:hypothetical protein